MARAVLRSLSEVNWRLAQPTQAYLHGFGSSRNFHSSSRLADSVLPSGGETTARLPHPTHTSNIRALLPLLASQPKHYITIHVHGKPYLVTPGDAIRLPFKMPGVLPGDTLRLNRATLLGSRDLTLKGAPYIDETLFECRAVVLGTEAEPMQYKIKKKQRNRRTKTVKSKHSHTVLRVQELKISGPSS